MKQYLIDVNVLIALFDSAHEFHKISTSWASKINFSIVICPIVENGFIRICTHEKYPNGSSSFNDCLSFLKSIRSLKKSSFISDSFSFSNESSDFPKELPIPSKHITDLYLLHLAKLEDCYFATFDKSIPKSLISDLNERLVIIK